MIEKEPMSFECLQIDASPENWPACWYLAAISLCGQETGWTLAVDLEKSLLCNSYVCALHKQLILVLIQCRACS